MGEMRPPRLTRSQIYFLPATRAGQTKTEVGSSYGLHNVSSQVFSPVHKLSRLIHAQPCARLYIRGDFLEEIHLSPITKLGPSVCTR